MVRAHIHPVYGDRAYAHLRENSCGASRILGREDEQPDPRDAQITRLKDEIARLNERLTRVGHLD